MTLLDGSTVRLRPLSIKRVKLFMKELDKLSEVKSEDDTLDALIDLARTCLAGINAEQGNSEDLDDLLDLQTCYKIIEICGGVKLNDPNLIAAAMETAQNSQN